MIIFDWIHFCNLWWNVVTWRVVAEPFLDLAEVELSGLISVPEPGQEDEDSEAAGEAEQQVSPEQQPEASS